MATFSDKLARNHSYTNTTLGQMVAFELTRAKTEYSHQTLSCLRSGVDYSRFIGNDTAEELLTPL